MVLQLHYVSLLMQLQLPHVLMQQRPCVLLFQQLFVPEPVHLKG